MGRPPFLDRPPRVLSALAIVWLVIVLVQNSDAGMGIIALFTLTYGGLAIAVTWIVRFVLFVLRRWRDPDRHFSKLWVVPPAALLVSLSVALLDAPSNALFRLRFALSERALTREAQAWLVKPEGRLERQRLGLFFVKRVIVHDRQVRFITTACGVVDSCGVVYSPDKEPTRWQEDVFTHLHGSWWHLFEGF